MSQHFIIIDDDKYDNLVTEMLIKGIDEFPGSHVISFSDVNAALDFIQKNYSNAEVPLTIILLDLHMPQKDGWYFLEKFEQFPGNIKSHFKISFSSSSIESEDHERAFENPHVIDFYIKPVTKEQIVSLMHRVYKR